jgi:HlyD family secretion protein
MRKKVIPVVILVIVAALAAWRLLSRPAFRYAGTVEATEVDLSPRLTSTIAEIPVVEGQDVKAGQLVVRLSGEDYKIAAEQADSDFKRAKKLLTAGSMTAEAYDKIRFRYEDAALHVSWLNITSPINGVVLDKFHEVGEQVSPPMRLLKLADLNDIWATIYVPQTMLARLKLGMSVTATLPELNNRTLEGHIKHIRDEAEFTPRNVQTREERARLVYAVKVALPNGDRLLKPGMTVEVALPE